VRECWQEGKGEKKGKNVKFCTSRKRDIFNNYSINCQQDLIFFFLAHKTLGEPQTALGGSLAPPVPSVQCCVQINSYARAAPTPLTPPAPAPGPPHPPFCRGFGSARLGSEVRPQGWIPLRLPCAGARRDGEEENILTAIFYLYKRKTPSLHLHKRKPPCLHPGLAVNEVSATGTVISTITMSNQNWCLLLTRGLKREHQQ